MKRITRRQFAAIAGGAALAPVAVRLGAAPASAGAPAAEPPATQQSDAAARKSHLTPEQEERVQQAVARRDRQLAALRQRALPYELEPAFVFRVRSQS